jgi:single-stranded DNA-binding protein
MAEIITDPQLRYIQDNQMAIAEMEVQFSGLRPDDPPAKLKVIGWGNLAQEISQKYHAGEQVVIEGRLSMNAVDRPEGFKEKRAELVANKLYPLSLVGDRQGAVASTTAPSPTAAPVAAPAPAVSAEPVVSTPTKAKKTVPTPPPIAEEPDFDEIPF